MNSDNILSNDRITSTKRTGIEDLNKNNNDVAFLKRSRSSLPPPIVYTIAGSDSGGGAGIQADLHAIQSFHCHGCSIITCLTAQNSITVSDVHVPPISFLQSQFDTLLNDLIPTSIKIGMIGTKDVAYTIGHYLKQIRDKEQQQQKQSNDQNTYINKTWIVLDPVMISTSGSRLISEETQQVMIEHIFPYIDILTPNIYEAQVLLNNRTIITTDDIQQAARGIITLYNISAVLIKGGHIEQNNDYAQDYFLSSSSSCSKQSPRICDNDIYGSWIQSKRYPTIDTHGTGCTLSSSIASVLALGEHSRRHNNNINVDSCWNNIDLLSACCLAKAYISAGLESSIRIGNGPGPVQHTGFPMNYKHFPIISNTPITTDNTKNHHHNNNGFAKLYPFGHNSNNNQKNNDHHVNDNEKSSSDDDVLGLILPIVDSLELLERLCQTNSISDIQLRLKNMNNDHEKIEQYIRNAQSICQQYNVRLWINDYWEIAIKVNGVYGIHIGQEDLYNCIQNNGIQRIKDVNMGLGISTHSLSELAVAIGIEPSYISLGPIYPTSSKNVLFYSQGLSSIQLWKKYIPPSIPLCTIGGINTPELVQQVRYAGSDCVAVISAITNNNNDMINNNQHNDENNPSLDNSNSNDNTKHIVDQLLHNAMMI